VPNPKNVYEERIKKLEAEVKLLKHRLANRSGYLGKFGKDLKR
ncbi:hypothetical protein LCGC14_2411430, partial [marine sediment metagenome]